jgi:SAM-dependent methyltransferase
MTYKFKRRKPRNLVTSIVYRIAKLPFLPIKVKFRIYSDLSWIFFRLSNEYSWPLFNGLIHPSRDKTLDFLENKIDKNDRVLDVGCSRGEITDKLGGMCDSVVGVDHNKHLIEEAKTRYQSKNVEFIACDAISYLSESNSSFDIMICSHILEHLDNPSNFLSLFKSYFKNIYIEVPDADNTYMNLIRTNLGVSSMYTDDDHIYEFTREDLENLVIENDMKIVESEFRYGVIKLWIET